MDNITEVLGKYYFILDGHEPIPEPDVDKWEKWFATADRCVARDRLTDKILVSTVFLGINHSIHISPYPTLFETMVFGADEEYQQRYSSWDEAVTGHKYAIGWAARFTKDFHKITNSKWSLIRS